MRKLNCDEVYRVYYDRVHNKAIIEVESTNPWFSRYYRSTFMKTDGKEFKRIDAARNNIKKQYIDMNQIESGSEYEVYEPVKIEVHDKKLLFAYLHEDCDNKHCFGGSDGFIYSLGIEEIKDVINNGHEFINIKLDENDNIIEKRCGYTKYKSRKFKAFVGGRKDPMWDCLKEISNLSVIQKVAAKGFIRQNATDDLELKTLMSLFLTPRKWFPNKFWCLDPSVRYKAFKLMDQFGICKVESNVLIIKGIIIGMIA